MSAKKEGLARFPAHQATKEKTAEIDKIIGPEGLEVNHHQAAGEFLQALWPDDIPDGRWLYLWTNPGRRTFWTQGVGDAAGYASEVRDKNVYVGLGLSPTDFGPTRRCASSQVCALPGVRADIDIANGVAHSKGNLPTTLAEARSILDRVPIKPTILVHTGYGLQAHWLFKEPWPLDNDIERQEAATLLKAWNDTIRDHAKALGGWDVDATHDLARVFRVPGTFNVKDPDNPKPVTVLEHHDEQRYNPEDFEEFTSQPQPRESRPAPPQEEARSAAPEAVRASLDVLMEDSVFRRTWERNRPDLKDQSMSGYDMALANLAAHAGADDSAIEAIISEFRRQKGETPGDRAKGSRRDYLQRTVARARQESALACPCPTDQASYAITLNVGRAIDEDQRGAANLYIALRRDKRIFDHASGIWHSFNGVCWTPDRVGGSRSDVEAVARLVEEEAKRRGRVMTETMIAGGDLKQAKDAFKVAISRTKDLRRKRYIDDVLQLAADGHNGLSTPGDEWDKHPMLLPCRNGVLDLETGQLRPGRPKDMLRNASHTPFYGLDTPCPKWEAFISSTFAEDQDKIGFVHRLLGYCLTGSTQDHVFPVFVGNGRNGKGTLIETVAHILGHNLASPSQVEMILSQGNSRNASAPTPEIIGLFGNRLSWCSEPNENARYHAGRIKWLTGGDTLNGRHLYGKDVAFSPTHKLILLTNHEPIVDGADDAYWDRAAIVKFPMHFVDEASDDDKPDFVRAPNRKLGKELCAEAPGILAWLVRGCMAWQRKGLCIPRTVRDEGKSLRTDCDPLAEFLSDCATTGQGDEFKTRAKSLWGAYQAWCQSNGEAPANKTRFGRTMAARFHKDSDRVYHGVKLNAGFCKDCND